MITSPVIDTRCKSPLHLAAKSGHDDIVHYLLQGGANVNEERAEGTPLHVAALYGKTDIVKLLIRVSPIQRFIQNPLRHLRWSFLRK